MSDAIEPPFITCLVCKCDNREGSTADERFCFDPRCPARETESG